MPLRSATYCLATLKPPLELQVNIEGASSSLQGCLIVLRKIRLLAGGIASSRRKGAGLRALIRDLYKGRSSQVAVIMHKGIPITKGIEANSLVSLFKSLISSLSRGRRAARGSIKGQHYVIQCYFRQVGRRLLLVICLVFYLRLNFCLRLNFSQAGKLHYVH